jgi:two-component system CheB/CheR fusion protein
LSVVADETEGVEPLVEHLRDERGFDFSGYKRASLERRLARRLAAVGVTSYREYVDYLQVHPEEFTLLFNNILINVTSFFRDTDTWDFLRTEVVPAIIRAKGPSQPIRIWSAGCSSGQEPATVAMLFAHELGTEEYRDRVKVYATDVDEEALANARGALYTERDVAGVPEEYKKYIEPAGDKYVVAKELRRGMIFGRHDLLRDAPISRVDLLLCRNVLIYVDAETQATVLNRLNFAMNDDAYLCLGKAEMLLTHGALFQPVDLRRRVFRKAERTLRRGGGRATFDGGAGGDDRVLRLAFDTGVVAQIVLDGDDLVAFVNQRAVSLFDLGSREIGRPFQDLDVSYRPADLRTAVDQARVDRRTIRLRDVEWVRASGERLYLDIQVVPLLEGAEGPIGVSMTFNDVTRTQEMQLELEHANVELETAYEELQSTNEELETTNEELQSTIEELETTNEELQSTNEELETMNEELQSTNDELQTINEQARERGVAVDAANAFLRAIVASMAGAVAVVDSDLRVRLWTDEATEMWGLRSDEVRGEPFLALDIGLPAADVAQPIRQVLSNDSTEQEVEVAGHDRRGRPLNLVVRIRKVHAPGEHGFEGAIVYAVPTR